MTGPMLFMAGVVFLIGIPAAFFSRTVAALVVAYLIVQGLWMATGAVLSSMLLFWIDIACIAAICTRPPAKECYPDWPLPLCLLWLERSWCDRIVLVGFPAAWWVYAFEDAAWWPLYFISLVQLLVASGEALHSIITRRVSDETPAEDEEPHGDARFVILGSSLGGG